MGFDEVFQFRWVIGLPVSQCEHVSGILLELGDQGGSATVGLAEQITRKESREEKDRNRGDFFNHSDWTTLMLSRREEADERILRGWNGGKR